MNDLYSKRCEVCGDLHIQDLADNTTDWDAIYSEIARQLLAGEDVESDALYKATADKLVQALSEGLQLGKYDDDESRLKLAAALKSNIYQFSSAKTNAQLIAYRNAMIDSDGKILAYESFKKVIADQGEVFNNAHLKAEFDVAKQSAIMAHKWDTLNTELLEFTTVGDGRVRPEHKVFDKFTAPKNDPIWRRLYTPLAFGCRCTIIPGITKNLSQTYNSEWANTMVDPLVKGTTFDNNVGISKEIFTKQHPYFKVTNDGKKDNANFNFKENKALLVNSLVKGNVTIPRAELSTNITFTASGIKESLNQPHPFLAKKNKMLLSIDKVLKNATYLGSNSDHKQNPMVAKIHIFETKVNGVRTFLINRELKTGEIHFYSTSDSENVIKGIKK